MRASVLVAPRCVTSSGCGATAETPQAIWPVSQAAVSRQVAQVPINVPYGFCGHLDGARPQAEPTGVGGAFYGTAREGGANAQQCFCGTTLLPVPEKSVNFDSTENLIIEGDNLEILNLLQKSYLGKIKMYIDPPYNTGNDFIYPDDYSESLKTYLQYTGQVDSEGKKFGTNNDVDGRFHSRWINMMYTRLYLARNLLSTGGIIFASVGQDEIASLFFVCGARRVERQRVGRRDRAR